LNKPESCINPSKPNLVYLGFGLDRLIQDSGLFRVWFRQVYTGFWFIQGLVRQVDTGFWFIQGLA
jgi:hypothetical protein